MDNLFVGSILCGEVSESSNKEDLKYWLGYSGASLHTTYTKINLTDVEECKVDVTFGNGPKMKCELMATVSIKLQGGEMVKFNDILNLTQSIKNLLRVSRLVAKGYNMGEIK